MTQTNQLESSILVTWLKLTYQRLAEVCNYEYELRYHKNGEVKEYKGSQIINKQSKVAIT